MRLSIKYDALEVTPLRLIKWFIAIQTILGGVYLLSPLVGDILLASGTSVIARTVTHPIGIAIVGVTFLASGIILAVGLIRNKKQWVATGLFVNALVRMYGILAGWMLNGFLPPSWLAGLTLLFVVIVCYFYTKKDQKFNGRATSA